MRPLLHRAPQQGLIYIVICHHIAWAWPGSCHRRGSGWRQPCGGQHSYDACIAVRIMGRGLCEHIGVTPLNKQVTAVQDSGALSKLVAAEHADVVCLQETKLKDSDVEACEAILQPMLPGWHFYWNTSIARKGYSGTAILSRSALLICVPCMHSPVHLDLAPQSIFSRKCFLCNARVSPLLSLP